MTMEAVGDGRGEAGGFVAAGAGGGSTLYHTVPGGPGGQGQTVNSGGAGFTTQRGTFGGSGGGGSVALKKRKNKFILILYLQYCYFHLFLLFYYFYQLQN